MKNHCLSETEGKWGNVLTCPQITELRYYNGQSHARPAVGASSPHELMGPAIVVV